MSDMQLSKYRVTFRQFKEYEATGTHLTNVHILRECDVAAVDGVEAIKLAGTAFSLEEEVFHSGDWKVRMLAFPVKHEEFMGCQPNRSTIVNSTRMGD